MQHNTVPVIQLRNLTKTYTGQDAVHELTLTIRHGEIVGFVGLNGAGKSTTINLLLGFIGATRGSIELFGKKIRPHSAHKVHHRIGYASGDMSLFDHLTGDQYLRFLEHRYHVRNRTKRRELEVRFKPELSKRLGDLSRGNRQKVALIAAFFHDPELVILDEPSSGLDPLMQAAFVELIQAEQAAGTTVFMSSHYLTEVSEVCSRILCIREGTLIRDLSASELERLSGKAVRVVSAVKLKPPQGADHIETSGVPGRYELTFMYKSDPAALLHWLALRRQVIDFTVNEHDAAIEFASLMNLESEATHV